MRPSHLLCPLIIKYCPWCLVHLANVLPDPDELDFFMDSLLCRKIRLESCASPGRRVGPVGCLALRSGASSVSPVSDLRSWKRSGKSARSPCPQSGPHERGPRPLDSCLCSAWAGLRQGLWEVGWGRGRRTRLPGKETRDSWTGPRGWFFPDSPPPSLRDP